MDFIKPNEKKIGPNYWKEVREGWVKSQTSEKKHKNSNDSNNSSITNTPNSSKQFLIDAIKNKTSDYFPEKVKLSDLVNLVEEVWEDEIYNC